MSRPQRFRRIITGGQIGSLALDTSLVPHEAQYCQTLLDLIDNKDAFTLPIDQEDSAWVVASIKEVRTLATSTVSLVDAEEVVEEVRNIATACRQFMRDFHPNLTAPVQQAALEALRVEVGGSLAVLVRILGLRPPQDFILTPYEGRALRVLEGWLDRT